MFTRLKNYIRKWLVFIPVIHRYQPWDYSYYLELNIAALKLIEQAVFDEGIGLYTERQRRDIKTAQEALRRLRDDRYTDGIEKYIVEYKVDSSMLGFKTLPGFKREIERTKSQQKQDLRLFTSIFNKRLHQWWD